jgi:hypothetical protein
MGLLDDAIREHLDLKRRHGAESSELERLEHEALGPALRGPGPDELGRESGDEGADAAEPAPAPAPAEEPSVPVAQPTAEYDVASELADAHQPLPPPPVPEETLGEEEDPEGEDVLEETPEFLQETPEHDRLWFEQKPPRDFDFDR